MAPHRPSKTDRARWRDSIVEHLGDFPRQYRALETAMAPFGDDFDLPEFKSAFDTTDDFEAYNRAQALERAVTRVQNYVGELAENGAKLAGLPPPAGDAGGSAVERAFQALRETGVIDGNLCRRLIRAQDARRSIEHSKVKVNAGDVHRATNLVYEAAADFIRKYRDWIEPFITDDARPEGKHG